MTKIVSLLPDEDDREAYDPLAAFEFHLQMAMKLANDGNVRLLTLTEYPDDKTNIYFDSNFKIENDVAETFCGCFSMVATEDDNEARH